MGTTDRLARTVIAVVILILLMKGTLTGTFALILCVFAIVFLSTSATGWCPFYKPMNINTKKTEQKQDG